MRETGANSRAMGKVSFARLRAIVLLVWAPLVLAQSLIWLSSENVLAALMAICGGVLAALACFRRDRFRAFPISTAMMIGYASYYFYLPPLVTLVEGKPLTNNLDFPVLVFSHALVCQIFLLFAYAAYVNLSFIQSARRWLQERIFAPSGYFRVPGNLQMFLIGGMGLVSMAYQVFVAGAGQGDVQGAANKVMQALYPLAYIPFCMLVRPMLGDARRIRSKELLALFAYSLILLVVSLGHNTRSAFLLGAASVLMVAIFGALAGVLPAKLLRMRNVVAGTIAVVVVMGPLADLATSMVVVRQMRRNVSPIELVRLTLDAYQDKEAIRERRLKDATGSGYWDERYVDNIFFARLSNLKFADSSIGLAVGLNEGGKAYLRRIEWQRVVSILPRPVIAVVAPSVDKDYAGAASGGDFLLYAVTRNKYVLGGFRVGSLFGSGYGLFGWFYPFVIAALAVPIFVVADSQTRTVGGRLGSPALAPMAAIGFFAWFFYFTSAATGAEAVSTLPSVFLREWIQTLVIYAMAYWSTHLLVIGLRRERTRQVHLGGG